MELVRILGTPEAGDHLLDLDEAAREAFDDHVYDEDLDAYDTLEQSRLTVEPVYVHEIGAAEATAGKGTFLWDATIEYTDPERTRPQIDVPQTGESVFSFDISAGTQHRTYSRSTRAHHYRSGFPSTDYSSGIGWDGERFTGVDVYVRRNSLFGECDCHLGIQEKTIPAGRHGEQRGVQRLCAGRGVVFGGGWHQAVG